MDIFIESVAMSVSHFLNGVVIYICTPLVVASSLLLFRAKRTFHSFLIFSGSILYLLGHILKALPFSMNFESGNNGIPIGNPQLAWYMGHILLSAGIFIATIGFVIMSSKAFNKRKQRTNQ